MSYVKMLLKRPVSVTLIIGAIVIFGFMSIANMQLEYFPNLEMPMELVYIVYPGADADQIEKNVTEPIEDIGKSLTGIHDIASSSYDNYAMVQFTYEYGTDIDDAYMELKSTLDNLESSLPSGCKKPTIMEININSDATLSIAAQSQDAYETSEYINNVVVQKIETINGVAQVNTVGVSDKYLKIIVDEEKMQQYGVSLSSIATAISGSDFSMPLGYLETKNREIALSSETEMDWQHNLPSITIKTSKGGTVALSDVTNFINLYQDEPDSISRYNGNDSIMIDITKKNTASTFAMCKAVESTLQSLEYDGLTFQTIHSTADDIMDTLIEVATTLIEGIIFTMLILFIFFGDIKASFIVGSSMPISMLITMMVLYFLKIPFDLMTGTGMIIAIGMIVDNSIVVLESCFRMREQNLDVREAAIKGTGSMLLSVLASTITTVVVFAPICFASGMTGQMMGSLCYTIIFTMIASLLSAVSVVPSFFVRLNPNAKDNLPINKLLKKVKNLYAKTVPTLMNCPKRTLACVMALFIISVTLAMQLPFDVFPSNYDGSIIVTMRFRSGTTNQVIDDSVQNMEKTLLQDTNFSSIAVTIQDGEAKIVAYSAPNCKKTSEERVSYYLKQFDEQVNMDVTIEPSGVTAGLASLMSTGNNITITLQGQDLTSLEQGAGMVADTMREIPGVIKVSDDFSKNKTNGKILIDSDLAINKGLTPTSISTQLYNIVSGVKVMTIENAGTDYEVKLMYPEGDKSDVSRIMENYITNSEGVNVPVNEVATLTFDNQPQTIQRQNDYFISTITATTESDAKYTVSNVLTKKISELQFPDGVSKGTSQTDSMMMSEMGNMGIALLIAVLLVFLVMSIQFESIKYSLMVMSCIPFSMIGSFSFLFVANAPMSMMAMLGFLMLVGMVVNNGILLIDGTNELKKRMPVKEALLEAGLTRLRPILMTTLTTVISMLPLILPSKGGMNMMRGMALVIIGGLCTSTILALFIMPPFYILLNGKEK